MKTISSVKTLPDWFKNRKYPKQQSAIAWFRDIRRRQFLMEFYNFSEQCSDREYLHKEISINLWLKEWNPETTLFHIDVSNKPIKPLTVFEAKYLNEALRNECYKSFDSKLGELMTLWRKELNRTDNPLGFSYSYEKCLSDFMDYVYTEEVLFQDVLNKAEVGNPLLSYSKPLNGYPVTIDTQYDDLTILKAMKEWLNVIRKNSNEKAKRPFNQNDFDDWAYFKIREVCDLDMWSKLSGVKILDKVIANALWSDCNEDISPIDILRTTTRKKIREVFSLEVTSRFYGQLIIQEGENFLSK